MCYTLFLRLRGILLMSPALRVPLSMSASKEEEGSPVQGAPPRQPRHTLGCAGPELADSSREGLRD